MPAASGFQPPTEQARADVEHELNLRDLGDISFLKKCEPFERYWMRCLRQKRDAKHDDLLRKECTKDQREEIRQQVLLLDELMNMMKDHEASIRRAVVVDPSLESLA